uniref:Uncharacterized protein n=1 Tax=Rhizophora mucronata TaxID=61149 RepID=A0A2P2NDT5_RHIMU
MAIIYFLLGV